MSRHTPGPWAIQRGNSSNPMVGTDAVSVAEVLDDVYPDVAEQEANARLIAAAPDLKAVCERLVFLDTMNATAEDFRRLKCAAVDAVHKATKG